MTKVQSQGGRWGRRNLGSGSDWWSFHAADEVAFKDEDWQSGEAFEWSV